MSALRGMPLRGWRRWVGVVLLGTLAACSTTSDRPKPAELGPDPNLVGSKQVWSHKLGSVDFALNVPVHSEVAVLASADGTLVGLNVHTGATQWRTAIDGGISAGVGADGQWQAVVTRTNQLVVLERERELWRSQLIAQVFTAPLVAGGRVFVLTADRAVSAYDARSGRRLWTQPNSGESLVLRKAGVLMPVGDTLVVGRSGRLLGLDPTNGQTRWEVVVGQSRGTNDVERLIDVVGPAARDRATVCVRSFQAAISCVDAVRGNLTWTKATSGETGLSVDETQVFGTESSGKVMAWRRSNGERLWVNEKLQHRVLSAPLVLGRTLVLGDDSGQLHWLSRTDGQLQHRVATDGSAIATTPVLADGTLIAVTRNGLVSAYVPD